MVLARVITSCEDEMICDLAETYHVLDYRGLSPHLVATLVFGLKDESRVKMHLSDTKITMDRMLLAMIADQLRFIAWTKTKAATKGKNKPKPILAKLLSLDEKKDELEVFKTPEEYEAYMNKKREEWANG